MKRADSAAVMLQFAQELTDICDREQKSYQMGGLRWADANMRWYACMKMLQEEKQRFIEAQNQDIIDSCWAD